jgi:hypothetical protein
MSNESEQHNAEELSSEVKLIISLIAYAVFDCEKTEEWKSTKLRAWLSEVFNQDDIDQAVKCITI